MRYPSPPGIPWVKLKIRMQFRGLGSKNRCSSHPGVNFPSDIPVGHSGAVPWVVSYKNLLNCVPIFPFFYGKIPIFGCRLFSHARGIKAKICTGAIFWFQSFSLSCGPVNFFLKSSENYSTITFFHFKMADNDNSSSTNMVSSSKW